MIPTRVAFFVATLVQAILYGFYLDTFAQCLRWLLCEDQGWKLRPRGKMNRAMLTITVLILALTSADTLVALKISLTQLGSSSSSNADATTNGNGLVGGKLGIVNVRILLCRKRCFLYLLTYYIIRQPVLKTFTALLIGAVLVCLNVCETVRVNCSS
jgi:hypothetical protein